MSAIEEYRRILTEIAELQDYADILDRSLHGIQLLPQVIGKLGPPLGLHDPNYAPIGEAAGIASMFGDEGALDTIDGVVASQPELSIFRPVLARTRGQVSQVREALDYVQDHPGVSLSKLSNACIWYPTAVLSMVGAGMIVRKERWVGKGFYVRDRKRHAQSEGAAS